MLVPDFVIHVSFYQSASLTPSSAHKPSLQDQGEMSFYVFGLLFCFVFLSHLYGFMASVVCDERHCILQ